VIDKVRDEEAPALRHLMRVFSPDCEFHFLDPDEPVECALLDLAADPALGAVPELVAQIRRELAAYGSDPDLLVQRLSMYVVVPTGGTWRAWWDYLAAWLPEYGQDPSLDPKIDNRTPLPRASRFTDHETANRAVTEVLRANEPRFRAWAADPQAPRRLHLYAGLGRDIGVVMVRDATGRPTLSEPARACAVTMTRDPAGGNAMVAAAYPEILLPSGPRERYPELPDLFGAYFGQDHDGLDTQRWRAEWRFNIRLTDELRVRTAEQLRHLLAEPDEELGRSVEALGSYVLPAQMRRWVTGLLRRVTVPDWTLPPGFIDPVTH
jgi:hypothetical protein